MLNVSIYRYNPEIDSEPYMQDFKVDTQGKDVMVLDVLEKLKTEDPTLSFRRSCREGVCGSDGVNISGKNGLACITPLSEAVKGNKRWAPSFQVSCAAAAVAEISTTI